jgi:hypothetical protein
LKEGKKEEREDRGQRRMNRKGKIKYLSILYDAQAEADVISCRS